MAKNTRYNALRERIKEQFSKNRTYSLTTAANGRELLFNLTDPANVGNDAFLSSGPFNFVYVRNFGNADARVYFSADRELFIDVPAPSNQSVGAEATNLIPKRYVSYLTVENLSGTDPLDLEVQVGNTVDSVELNLLEASGMLDVQE